MTLFLLSNVWSFLTVIVLSAFSLILICVSGFSLYIFRQHWKYGHIPGPKRNSFFLGNLPELMKGSKKGKGMHEFCYEWTKEHGPVFVLFFMHQAFVIVLDPAAVKYLLITMNAPKPRSAYEPISSIYGERFVGHGLPFEIDRAKGLKRRQLLDPVFHRKLLMNLMGQYNNSADLLIKKLITVADGKTPVVMIEEFSNVALDIIAKVAFDMDLNVFSEVESSFSKDVKLCLEALVQKIFNPFEEYNPFKARVREEVRRTIRALRRIGQEEVERRLAALSRGQDAKSDLLGCILKASDYLRDPDFQMVDVVDEFITFFVAGQETTANQLSSTLMELLRYPEIEQRLKTEIDYVLNGRKFVEYEDLGKLSYTSKVMKESLRLHPPATRIMRENTKDEVFAGIKVPAHSNLMLSTYVMSRMEDFFEDALVFNPDRFDEFGKKSIYAYFPFSLGPRNCIGKTFAQIEVKVLMARLLTEFDFTWVPEQSYEMLDLMTNRPKDGCQTYIKRRGSYSQ